MHDLADRWVNDEPANLSARDLLASSYRKLADERRIVGDHDAARRNYLQAIAIGHEVLAADPDNFIFKRHLATAADDLAGVAQSQGQIAEARGLFEEAQRFLAEQVEADPEDLESQFRLIRVELRLARLERDDFQFTRAAVLFGRALERRRRLDQNTRFGGVRAPKNQEIALLRSEIAACALAPQALADLGFARAQSPTEACLLLMIRFRAMRAGPAARVACGGRGAVRLGDGHGGGRPVSPGASPRGVSRSARQRPRDHARGARAADAARPLRRPRHRQPYSSHRAWSR